MSEYTKAVKAGLEGLKFVSTGVCAGCEECQKAFGLTESELSEAIETGKLPDEPYFSWMGCEGCGSTLGGDRESAHGIDANGDIVHFSVCVDCVVYFANGDEPENWSRS